MVETRNRRKSTAPAAATPASGRHGSGGAVNAAPSTSGQRAEAQQGAAPADGVHTSYAEVYRQAALRAKQAEQASVLRRLKGRIGLLYHQQAMTWGWYMLEPWETVLWMSLLAFLCWLVISACFVKPDSICSSTLTAARKALAEQGAKLLAFAR